MCMFRVRYPHVIVSIDNLRYGTRFALQPLVETTLPVHPDATVVGFVLAEVVPVVHETLGAPGAELVECSLGETISVL